MQHAARRYTELAPSVSAKSEMAADGPERMVSGRSTRRGPSTTVAGMNTPSMLPPVAYPRAAWLTAGLAGFAFPALALVLLGGAAAGPVLAVGLMGAGMIAGAIAGRLWIGIALALLAGTGLIGLALALGMQEPVDPLAALIALVIASLSFAARGALFARSGGARGWWIALAVVSGEAAMVATAAADPAALPGWLLALLPAQWATTAIGTALAGSGVLAAGPVLLALGGTAATTLLVALLWPRRWPYLVMFSAWLGLSALVYNYQSAPDPAPAAAVSPR